MEEKLGYSVNRNITSPKTNAFGSDAFSTQSIMSDPVQVYGISWFQPEQWERLLEVSSDRESLDNSYEEWRENANKAIHEFRAQGQKVKKVKLNLEEFLYWCNENKKETNGSARAEYVAILMENNNGKS